MPKASGGLTRICRGLSREDGYALPSVLMLVTILSLVAFSVLSLEYLERKSAMLDVARVKSEYAAQNGITCMAAELEAGSSSDSTREFSFYDGSHASVKAIPWGALYFIESRGIVGKVEAIRRATLGAKPGEAFSLALALGNTSHQLILTGDASIKGDVAVGPGGVSTGQLHGYSTPAALPIQGKITSLPALGYPQVDAEKIKFIRSYYQRLLQARTQNARAEEGRQFHLNEISDSLGSINVPAGSVLTDSISRANTPLYVYCAGRVVVASGAMLSGLISVISSDSILVENGASVSGSVLVAMKGIRVGGAFLSSTQLISPQITLNLGCQGTYPCIVLSVPIDPAAALSQKILIGQGAIIEGFVGMVSPRGDDVLDIATGARVRGGVFSSSRLTLDGDLVGSAVTSDLYFYEAPTSYFGWKRSGTIDRSKLPKGLLTAPIFKGKHDLAVFEWL